MHVFRINLGICYFALYGLYLKSSDPKQESKHILYLDTNNLYGCVMSKFLPTSGFKWIDPKDIDSSKNSNNSSKGCILEVDPEFPKQLLNYIMIII